MNYRNLTAIALLQTAGKRAAVRQSNGYLKNRLRVLKRIDDNDEIGTEAITYNQQNGVTVLFCIRLRGEEDKSPFNSFNHSLLKLESLNATLNKEKDSMTPTKMIKNWVGNRGAHLATALFEALEAKEVRKESPIKSWRKLRPLLRRPSRRNINSRHWNSRQGQNRNHGNGRNIKGNLMYQKVCMGFAPWPHSHQRCHQRNVQQVA